MPESTDPEAEADADTRTTRRRARTAAGGGTPEQIHLTWGEDPARSVVVSWASPRHAVNPRVHIGQRIIMAAERRYTDGLNGETTYTYHARVQGLRPGASYAYEVTADNDTNATSAFSATFTTPAEGRQRFRFTSFGDLATPETNWVQSYGQSSYAVAAVESFQPLFHLLNGDLCYANQNPAHQPAVWRDFGNNNQTSAANRPWMPCPGNHEVEFTNGPQGLTSYLTRYTLPDNHVDGFAGRWYSFRIGSVVIVSLDADDVIYQDAARSSAVPRRSSPRRPPATRRSGRVPRSTSPAIRAARRPAGWSARSPPRAKTTASTGSSCRCTSARCPHRPPATDRTWGSGSSGFRCLTGTPSTSWSAATTTTTNVRSPSATSTPAPDGTP